MPPTGPTILEVETINTEGVDTAFSKGRLWPAVKMEMPGRRGLRVIYWRSQWRMSLFRCGFLYGSILGGAVCGKRNLSLSASKTWILRQSTLETAHYGMC
jgi:hypothetical protein